MKAAQYHPDSGKIQVNEAPIPEITDNDILVKIASDSLCGSDLILIDGNFPGSSEPVTMGHEGAGYVEKCGTNVKGFKPGDPVGFLPIKNCCFTCRGCIVMNLSCETSKAVLQSFDVDGYFAEYAAVDYCDAILLPKSLDPKTASPLFCAGMTAFNAVNACECKPGDWIVMIGCGGLGQMGIQYAKAMGLKVIGVDVTDSVLSTAKVVGANYIYNSKTNPGYMEELKTLTGRGADATVVFSASKYAYVDAHKTLRVNGVLMVIGLCPTPMEVSSHDLMRGFYRIKAETTGPPWKFPKALDFTVKHKIVSRMDFYKLEDINKMIEKMRAGHTENRMVVTF